jgi:hypothetical protein
MPTSASHHLSRVLATVLVLVALPAGAKERVVTLRLGPFRVEANRDREVCQAVRIPNARGMEIVGSEVRSRTARKGTLGTHHFVAYGYRGAAASAFPNGMVDDPGCNGFGPSDFYVNRVSLAGSGGEQRKGKWLVTANAPPPGLSQPLPNPADAPNDAVVILNSHYFNVSSRPARGFVRVKLRLAPADPGKRVLRQVLAVGASRAIDVAPGETGSESALWQADGLVNPDTEGGRNPAGDVCLLYMTGHMHLRGTRFILDYEVDGRPPERRLDYEDYQHPTVDYYFRGRLLPAYTAENGWPRFRYTCEHANGTAGKPLKMGCEESPGVVPGISWAEAEARGISVLESHARPCGLDGVNCTTGTGRCVPANLVFGPLSDDDMCILVGAVFDPLPGLPPEQACDPNRRS